MTAKQAALVGVDWGTTNCRMMALDTTGNLLGVYNPVDAGAARLRKADYAPLLEAGISQLPGTNGSTPVLICGMAGARNGWQEAPYCATPASARDIAAQLTRLPGEREILIVPGVSQQAPEADVMRGEETQALGWLQQCPDDDRAAAWLCLPGTHSKWLTCSDSAITAFRTLPTGELYAALTRHSILVGPDQQESEAAFVEGLALARTGEGLLSKLFATRARSLVADLPASAAASFLSGLLIGTEVREQVEQDKKIGTIHLAGGASHVDRYQRALDYFGVACITWADEELVTAGLLNIWRHK